MATTRRPTKGPSFHAASLRHSRRLSERRTVDGRLVESRRRRRYQGVQRTPRLSGQGCRGPTGLCHRLRYARANALPRAVIDALPDLKLLITTGMRNASIDL